MGAVSHPVDIVQRISPEEIFFTIKELHEDAPNLIAHTSGKQLLYFLDIDMWKKEVFDLNATGRWFRLLADAGDDKILQHVRVTEPHLLVTAMSHFIRVAIRNPDVDLLEQRDELPPFTLDDLFFIDFLSPEHEDIIRKYLDVIFRWNTRMYFSLMEEIARGIHLENEDAALHWRRARMFDHGFPEFDEALEIYAYLARNVVTAPTIESSAQDSIISGPQSPVIDYPVKILDPDNFFRQCLAELQEPTELDRISTELAHLANKVMIADGRDPGAMEDLRNSLAKVSGYINIALEDLCADDISKASGLLRQNHMEILFRRGFSLILDLRKDIQTLLRNYDGGVENLGHPLAGLVEGLIKKRPVYADNIQGLPKPREFASIQDIRVIRELMDAGTIEDKWEPI